jgi:hypothetical protein
MTAALSRMTVRMDASDGAMFWDAAVRRAKADRQGVIAWARSFEDRRGELARPIGFSALRPEPWERVTAASHRDLCALVERVHTGVRGDRDMTTYHVRSRTIPQVLHDVFASETTLRLGDIPYLLSTPTRTNGELAFTALVDRLRGYGDHLAGPTDLFVALTRLEPVDPHRLVELQGVSVRLWSAEGGALRRFLRRSSPDAVQIVRQWVSGGGLPALRVSHRGGTLVVDRPSLPVPPATFGGLPPSLEAGHEDGVHEDYHDWAWGTETDAGMLPAWADLVAAKLQRSFDQKGRFAPLALPEMVTSPHPGPAVVHVLAATLSHADEDRRLLAVDAALTLMGRGLWDQDGYTACCRHLLGDGELRLGRLAHSWEQLILGGALRPLWPTAVTVLDDACSLQRMPAGLAELLGMLRRYVPAVPDAVVPDSLCALAVSRGSSKAKAEAVAFVSAAS